jgi:hypothetical protein
LWGNSASLTSVAATTTVASAAATVASAVTAIPTQPAIVSGPQPLDLFSDRNGTFSS